MIKFAIPGMYEQRCANMALLDVMKANKEFFHDDIEIEIIYGNPQFCIWDGGRVFRNYTQATLEEVDRTIKSYNYDYGKPIRYVFTNTELNETHYEDRFCNILLELGNHFYNEIVLGDEELLEYIKEKFTTYKFVSSTTKCLVKPSEAKEELNKDIFKLVCLDFNLNKNMKFLKSLNEEEVSKTEFLINAICAPGCPYRKDHYRLNSLSHLNCGRDYTMDGCGIKEMSVHPEQQCGTNNLSYEEIKNVYAPMGFEHFKIEGRTWDSLQLICNYANYMVKPEYKEAFICKTMDRAQELYAKLGGKYGFIK